jgi:hypothetical protein
LVLIQSVDVAAEGGPPDDEVPISTSTEPPILMQVPVVPTGL